MDDARIYADGRHYDRMFPPSGEILEFCAERARVARGPVLELACGSGLLSVPMARQGFDVTGIDRAPGMLRAARARAEGAGLRVAWHEGDMCDFNLGRRFDLVLLLSNALCHLLDAQSFESCLRCVRAHLSERGHFVLSVFVPDPALLRSECDEPAPFASYDDPDGAGRIEVTHTYRYEFDTQIKRVTTHHQLPGGEERTGRLDLRMYFPQELDALLRHNGLEIVEKCGAFDGRPFDAKSRLQVVTCRLAAR